MCGAPSSTIGRQQPTRRSFLLAGVLTVGALLVAALLVSGLLSCREVAEPTVTIALDPTLVTVGERLSVALSLSGYASPLEARLHVDSSQVAHLDWTNAELLVSEDTHSGLRIVAPAERRLGFTLEADEPGTYDVRVWAYGDAGFCSGTFWRCTCGTTHKTAISEHVIVTVAQ